MNTARRLGVSFAGPAFVYGPPIWTEPTLAGFMYTLSSVMTLPRCSGCGRPSGSQSSLPDRPAPRGGPRRHVDGTLQARVSVDLVVLSPSGIAGEVRLAAAGIAGCGGPALRTAANGKPFQQPRVEADVEP